MKHFFSMKDDVSPLIQLATPLVFTGLVQSCVWFFNSLFLAHLGHQALAAGSIVGWLFGTIAVILFGTLSSINLLVAYRHGANDHDRVALVIRDGLWLSILLVIPAFLLFWNMSPIFLLFGQSEAIVELAKSYLHALSWGLCADFVMIACLEAIIGLGHARVILVVTIVSVLLNIFFDYVFIFGKFGFPALGVAGAGWGMTVSYWISVSLLLLYIFVNKTYRHYFRFIFTYQQPSCLWELLRIGMPMGFMYCVEVGFFFALTLFIGLFGSQSQAANQVALQYSGVLMAIMFSIAQAITVRMGHLLGAQSKKAAVKSAYVGIFLAALIATIAGIFYWSIPQVFIAVDFNLQNPNNVSLIEEIKKLLMICAWFQIAEATRVALFGALRGLKDTTFTLLTSTLSFWGIAIPVGYLLAIYFKLGAAGFWWGMVLGASCAVFLLQWRLRYNVKRMR